VALPRELENRIANRPALLILQLHNDILSLAEAGSPHQCLQHGWRWTCCYRPRRHGDLGLVEKGKILRLRNSGVHTLSGVCTLEESSGRGGTPEGPMKVVAYARVSTETQAERGVSLQAQLSKLHAYAELYELEIVEVIEDGGASAKSLDRPGLQRALALLDAGKAQGLLVAKLDRLTRSVRDLDTLISTWFGKQGGPALLSVAEQIDTRSAAGRLVLNILASVSQWEREAIGERTATALAHKAERGERVGEIPLGYAVAEDGVKLEEHEGEQAAIALVQQLRIQALSIRAIATELTRRGVAGRGSRWHPTTVARLLRRNMARTSPPRPPRRPLGPRSCASPEPGSLGARKPRPQSEPLSVKGVTDEPLSISVPGTGESQDGPLERRIDERPPTSPRTTSSPSGPATFHGRPAAGPSTTSPHSASPSTSQKGATQNGEPQVGTDLSGDPHGGSLQGESSGPPVVWELDIPSVAPD
jgi:site-specific DNA recombinase